MVAMPMLFSMTIGVIGIIVGIICIVFGGQMYIEIAKAERIEKKDREQESAWDEVDMEVVRSNIKRSGGEK